MNPLANGAWYKASRAVLFLMVLLPAGCSRSSQQPITLRLAGDEWFLKSLTKTGMIAAYEQKSRRPRGSIESQ